MKTAHWHGNVKVTATSGGNASSLGLIALAVVAVLGGLVIAAYAAVIEIVLTVVAGAVVAGMVARVAWEIVTDKLADRAERRWRQSIVPAGQPKPLRVASERVAELEPIRTEAYVVDLERERQPVDLDALEG